MEPISRAAIDAVFDVTVPESRPVSSGRSVRQGADLEFDMPVIPAGGQKKQRDVAGSPTDLARGSTDWIAVDSSFSDR